MDSVPTFHIFSGNNDRDALWVCAVEGLANAKERMDQLAAEKPGAYFVFYTTTHEILSRTDTSKPVSVALRHPQLQVTLMILKKIGHTVGEMTVVDEEPRVSIDGQPCTYREIFQMVEDYNKRRTA